MKQALFLMLILVVGVHVQAQGQELSGWVSDAHCKKAHVGGKSPECVRKCMKGGAHIGHPEWTPQAMVLVVDGTEAVLIVENPELLEGREAQHVTVRGEVKEERIRISEVLP